jgi:hypothetical protein
MKESKDSFMSHGKTKKKDDKKEKKKKKDKI